VRIVRSIACITAGLLLVTLVASAVGQSTTPFQESWLKNPKGNLFFCLNGDGGKLLVNRSESWIQEELVEIPTGGGAERIWHTSNGRSIYDRFVFSKNGDLVVFATVGGSRVHALTSPQATPQVIGNVSPDQDPQHFRLSDDGKWVAFIASSFKHGGSLGMVRANLYVAATDGTALHRITANALPGNDIPFDISADGKTLVWVDDDQKGPLIAGINGQNARRLPLSQARVTGVFSDPTGAVVYFQTLNDKGLKLFSVKRDGTELQQVHAAQHGTYEVARDSTAIRLRQYDPKSNDVGTFWRLDGTKLEKAFTFKSLGPVGSWSTSGDGRVIVWRDTKSATGDQTLIWRAGS